MQQTTKTQKKTKEAIFFCGGGRGEGGRGYKRIPKFQSNNGCTEENYRGDKLKLLFGNFKIRSELNL